MGKHNAEAVSGAGTRTLPKPEPFHRADTVRLPEDAHIVAVSASYSVWLAPGPTGECFIATLGLMAGTLDTAIWGWGPINEVCIVITSHCGLSMVL
jgi:hypothetical protein